MKDAAQGVAEDVPQDVAQDSAFGARAARALLATSPPPPPCLCAVRAEMGAQLGCRAKRLFVDRALHVRCCFGKFFTTGGAPAVTSEEAMTAAGGAAEDGPGVGQDDKNTRSTG